MTQLIPNLLGMWVYADDRVPRHDPTALIEFDGRYYINTADVDAFHRWAAAKYHAEHPLQWRYQHDEPETPYQQNRRRLHDAVIALADELDDPMRFGAPLSLTGNRIG